MNQLINNGYTPCEYIVCSGSQYIDTGFCPNPTTTQMDITVSPSKITTTQGVFGSRGTAGTASNTSCNIFLMSGSTFRLDWVGNSSNSSSTLTVGGIYSFSCLNKSVILNGNTVTSTVTKGTSYLAYPIYIGNINNAGQGTYATGFSGKIYTSQIYDNGTLVRDYVPCHNSSNVYGLYDKVNDVFYSSETSTAFTGGPDIVIIDTWNNVSPFNFRRRLMNFLLNKKSYTINLNGQWQTSSKANPNSSLYDGVYESYSNAGVSNTAAIMYIDIKGYTDFNLYIRSYAESNYDYVMVSQLDKTITNSSSYSDTSLVKAHTRGNQQSGTAISNYTLVSFEGIDGGEHRITVLYRKDGSVNNGDDKGYLLIPKNQ